jgi:hypothetical protein
MALLSEILPNGSDKPQLHPRPSPLFQQSPDGNPNLEPILRS